MAKENLFLKLGRMFRGGPLVKRRVVNPELPRHTRAGASAYDRFILQSRELVNYANFLNYQSIDRFNRYNDFCEMEARPEIAAALDIYADETCSFNEGGEVVKIKSDNANIRAILETLFYDTLELDYNLPLWVRTLCKYGDFAVFNDIEPEYGIINVVPLPVTEFERVEGVDPRNPTDVVYMIRPPTAYAGFGQHLSALSRNVRSELSGIGGTSMDVTMKQLYDSFGGDDHAGAKLLPFQVTHFRLLGNDVFLPYGTSVLDPARRIWRLLYMTEDLMLMYRAHRASERRAFYLDVRNIPDDEVNNYMENAVSAFRRQPVVTFGEGGNLDYRFNPYSMSDDFFMPVRGADSGTRIETLPAGANVAQIEDVEYLHKLLLGALKIPRSYLGFGEGGEGMIPENLSQRQIHFAKVISRIQKVVLNELYKMAYIQLGCHGYEGEDMLNFELELASPSSAAQDQHLAAIKTRLDIASTALGMDGFVNRNWVRKNIMGFNDDEIDEIVRGNIKDAEEDAYIKGEISNIVGEEGEGGDDDAGGMDFGGFGESKVLGKLERHLYEDNPDADFIPKETDKYGYVQVNPAKERGVYIEPITTPPSPHSSNWLTERDEDNPIVDEDALSATLGKSLEEQLDSIYDEEFSSKPNKKVMPVSTSKIVKVDSEKESTNINRPIVAIKNTKPKSLDGGTTGGEGE